MRCLTGSCMGAAALFASVVLAPSEAAGKESYRLIRAPHGKHYSHVLELKMGPFDIPATQDREACQYVELPYDKMPARCIPGDNPGDPPTCGVFFVGYQVSMMGGSSHHFIFWSYEGSEEGSRQFPRGIHDSIACLDFGPPDTIHTRVGGSQTPHVHAVFPAGVAQPLKAFADARGKPHGIGLILDSHYLATGTASKAVVRLKIFLARVGTIRRIGKLLFDPVGCGYIDVPPGQVRTVGSDWEVGGPDLPVVGGPPQNDACVLFTSGHMHKRGLLFTTDLIDAQGTHRVNETTDWEHIPNVSFVPPLLMTRGMKFRYACTQDNGVSTAVRMGCELEPGVPPGISLFAAYTTYNKLDGSAQRCVTDADCTGVGTGRCVPANLVFGFTSDDEMCVLPGMYFDAFRDAPPGRECDISLGAPR